MFFFPVLICSGYCFCDYSYIVDDSPIKFAKRFMKNDLICINSSRIFLTILFNEWNNAEAKVNIISPNGNVKVEGPFFAKDNIGGFDFGKNYGSVEIQILKSTEISISANAFSNDSLARIVSNKPLDELMLAHSSNETLLITNNQHIEYFNGAPTTQNYNVSLNSEDGDLLEFVYHYTLNNETQRFCGELSFSLAVDDNKPAFIRWLTDKEEISGFVHVKVTTNDYSAKKYIRYITNDLNFLAIPYLKEPHLSSGQIVAIVFICIAVLIVGSAICIIFFLKRRKKIKIQKSDDIKETPNYEYHPEL